MSSIFQTIASKFKEDPIKATNDVVKATVGVATAVITIYAGVNAIRMNMVAATKKPRPTSNAPTKSGAETMLQKRSIGSPESKLGSQPVTNFEKSTLDRRNSVLDRIAKTRNGAFKSLSHDEQFELLILENFNFRKFLIKEKYPYLYPDETLVDGVYRKEKDHGVLNFILQPIDDFIAWVNYAPPKKPKQIDLVQRPKVPDASIGAIKAIESIHEEDSMRVPCPSEKSIICADEVFRHKTLGGFRKAVKVRMLSNTFKSQDLFDAIDADKKAQKKKKKKAEENYSYSDNSGKKSKKKKKSKKIDFNYQKRKEDPNDKKIDNRSKKEAKAMMDYYAQQVDSNKYDAKGFPFSI